MSVFFQVAASILSLYSFVLLARVVLDWARVFARQWRPTGVILILANLVYSLTDPPLRFLRRFIKPVRFGQISLDLAFFVLFIAVWFLRSMLLQVT